MGRGCSIECGIKRYESCHKYVGGGGRNRASIVRVLCEFCESFVRVLCSHQSEKLRERNTT